MTIHLLVPFFAGIGCGFLGNALFGRIARGRGGLTNFHRFLFSTGFAYACVLIGELVRFFADYYVGTSRLLNGGYVPAENGALFRLLCAGEARAWYPIFPTDLRLVAAMLGILLCGAAVVAYYERASKRRGDENGLLFGYVFPKTRFPDYVRQEAAAFRAQVPLPEYLLWWVLRGLMLWAFCRRLKSCGFDIGTMLLLVNGCMTFFVPVVRFLFFGKLFFGRVSYRTQSMIDLLIFGGSFLQHGVELNLYEFDKYLHLASGGLAVFIGAVLIRGTRRGAELSPAVRALGGLGFSSVVAVVWEVFEFVTDCAIPGANNQNHFYEPEADALFFRVFGYGAERAEKFGLLDTFFDLFFAALAALLCTAGYLLAASLLERRRAARKAAEPAAAETV